jgi:hypothetical protein
MVLRSMVLKNVALKNMVQNILHSSVEPGSEDHGSKQYGSIQPNGSMYRTSNENNNYNPRKNVGLGGTHQPLKLTTAVS